MRRISPRRLKPLSRRRHAELEKEAERLGRFYGGPETDGKEKSMNATNWMNGQSFNSGTRETTVKVGEYVGVPAEHHIHFCISCQKDYPCTSQHYRLADGVRITDTPPRATKHCPECVGLGF